MTVEDIYRITNSSQGVQIYNPKTEDLVFIGDCSNIPLSCLDITVSQIFTNGDILVIVVK